MAVGRIGRTGDRARLPVGQARKPESEHVRIPHTTMEDRHARENHRTQQNVKLMRSVLQV